ncbi:MAG TPA: hypothetical protein P5150_09085 [Candidatus Ratteibacteria bacterium]|nr:hypothetical protein [Candidatus Ratteibacteria bacterium]
MVEYKQMEIKELTQKFSISNKFYPAETIIDFVNKKPIFRKIFPNMKPVQRKLNYKVVRGYYSARGKNEKRIDSIFRFSFGM